MASEQQTDPGQRQLSDELDRLAVEPDEETPEIGEGDLVGELSAVTTRLGYGAAFGQGEAPAVELETPDPQAAEGWADLGETLAAEIAKATSPRRAAVLLHELGRLYEVQLGQPERALAAYRESHERFPSLAINARALARMLVRVGQFAEAEHALASELGSASSASERVAVRLERAMLQRRHLGDLNRASDELQKALEIDSDDGVVIQALIDLHVRNRDADQIEVLLRRQLRRTDDQPLRALYLCQVAQVREVHYADTEGAAKLYQTALGADPANQHAQRSLLRTARSSLDHTTTAKLCESLAEAEDGASAAALFWEAAQLYGKGIRDGEFAIRALERAIELAPQDQAILTSLTQTYERHRKWKQLVTTTERIAELSSDVQHSANARFRAARLRNERLHDAEGAMSSASDAFRLDSLHHGVRSTLGRLFARHERFEELLQLLAAELDSFDDPDRRVATAYRMADIYQQNLQDKASAIDAYERALELRPGYRPAVSALQPLYAQLDRYEDLVATLERQVGANADPEEKVVLLRQISEIWERALDNPAAALSAYERMIAIEPSNLTAMEALRRIYALGTRWQDFVGILRAEAEYTTDRWRRAALLSEIAQVYDQQLNLPEQALETCLAALEQVAQYQPALILAGRLLNQAGDHERLLNLHWHELEATVDPGHRAWLLIKIGRVLLERLGRPGEAIEAWLEAAAVATDSLVAVDLALRAARSHSDTALQLKVMSRLEQPESLRDRSLHCRRMARVLLAEGRQHEAVAQLRMALLGAEDPALHELATALAQLGDRRGLVELLESAVQQSDGGNAKLSLLHRLARIFGEMPHEAQQAAQTWGRVLDLSSRNPVALRQLEIISGELGRWGDLAAVVELQREHSDDEDFRLGCALEIAALREDRLDDLPGATQAAVEVLGRHTNHSEALSILERHARWSANPDELLQVLGRQLQGAQTAAEQAATLVATAAVHANCGRMDRACEFYRLAIDVMPSYLPAVRGWFRAAVKLQDTVQMARALELEARASQTPDRQASCWHDAAQLWELHNSDPERAAKGYWRVLQVKPGHSDASRALGALLADRQDYHQVITLLNHQVDHADTSEEQRDLLARMAEVQRSRLEQPNVARQTIDRALELFPQDKRLLSTLAELCRASEDYGGLIEANERLVRETDDPVLVKALHFEMGRLWEERLDQPERSIGEYRRVLELDPNDLGALRHLSALLFQRKEWADAAEATEKLAQRDNDRVRIKGYYFTLAQIYADGFSDLDRAVEVCRKALALDPGDARATDVMANLLQGKDDLRSLNAHLESTLAVHRSRLDRDPFAVESYRALLRVFERQNASQRTNIVHYALVAIGAEIEDSARVVQRLRAEGGDDPQRAITREELESVLVHPDERGALRQVLLSTEGLSRKIAPPTPRLPRKAHKLSPRSGDALALLVRHLSATLGAGGFNTYLLPSGPTGVFARDTATPSVIISGAAAQLPPNELRFLLARAIVRIQLRHTLAIRMGTEALAKATATLLWIVCATFEPPYARADLAGLRERLEKVLSTKLRTRLEAPAVALSGRPFEPSKWMDWINESDDRAALAASGDLPAALKVIQREEAGTSAGELSPERLAESAGPRVRHLLSFAVSEEYLTLRERLGLALR